MFEAELPARDNVVIFGHGFADPYLVTSHLAAQMSADFDCIVLDYFEKTLTHPIEPIAQAIYKVVETAASFYPNVFYVGHSLGGAIARKLATIDAEQQKIKGYATIASPLQGERRIKILPKRFTPPALQDLVPGSEYLTTTLEMPQDKTMELYAHLDPLVSRPRGAMYIPYTDHLSIVAAKRTYQEIWGFFVYGLLSSDGSDLRPDGIPGAQVTIRL